MFRNEHGNPTRECVRALPASKEVVHIEKLHIDMCDILVTARLLPKSCEGAVAHLKALEFEAITQELKIRSASPSALRLRRTMDGPETTMRLFNHNYFCIDLLIAPAFAEMIQIPHTVQTPGATGNRPAAQQPMAPVNN